MKRTILMLMGAWLASIFAVMAQDDIYFTPKKKKAKQTSVQTATETDDWTSNRESVMDEDTYNRRNHSVATSDDDDYAYYDDGENSESGVYTSRIVRFHSPGLTIVSSPYYEESIAIWADPWYAYRPFGYYTSYWDYHYGWGGYYSWNNYWWHHSWCDPWYHHAWYPTHHHHYHPIYRPSKPSHVTHRPKRPSAGRDYYHPSTERAAAQGVTKRPSSNARPSQNRNEQRNNNKSTYRPSQNDSRQNSVSTPSRPARERSFGTPSNSRSERSFQQGGSNRSMGSGSNRSGGRRR